MKKIFFSLVVLNSLFVSHFVFAATTLKADPSKGSVIFNATAIGLKFQGTGEGPQGEVFIDKSVQGTLKFKMETLDTKIGMRNSHMKEKYLEVAKYPYGELKLDEVTQFDIAKPEGKFAFKGTLTVHNVPQSVSGTVEVKKVGTGFKIKAEFPTKISLYSMNLPAYAGVVVKDDVSVVVETDLM